MKTNRRLAPFSAAPLARRSGAAVGMFWRAVSDGQLWRAQALQEILFSGAASPPRTLTKKLNNQYDRKNTIWYAGMGYGMNRV
jgi:hypothetical protein